MSNQPNPLPTVADMTNPQPTWTSPQEAAAQGFATYNTGQHLCVRVPKGCNTISAITDQGEKVTFAFLPYPGDKHGCVDIYHHHDQGDVINGSHAQALICFSGGGPDPFVAARNGKHMFRQNAKEVTLTSLLLLQHDREQNENRFSCKDQNNSET